MIFGPIYSRRLGKSIGINNIPSYKHCSYNCIYCQVGKTSGQTTKRLKFYNPGIIFNETKKHLEKLQKKDYPDYLTLVPSGEPTLDASLGDEIKLLKKLNVPVAVITNASLLHIKKVRHTLSNADLVSVKVDAGNAQMRKKINRAIPHPGFAVYKNGLLSFADEYRGKLITETMLIKDYNDTMDEMKDIVGLLEKINPDTAYISSPIRPPAEEYVEQTGIKNIIAFLELCYVHKIDAESLVKFDQSYVGYTGNAFDDILTTTMVHPLSKKSIMELLENDNAEWDVVESLINQNLLEKVNYNGSTFYKRKFNYTNYKTLY